MTLAVDDWHRDQLAEEHRSLLKEVGPRCEGVNAEPRSRGRWGRWQLRNPTGERKLNQHDSIEDLLRLID